MKHFLTTLNAWLAKLAFWRKPAADNSAAQAESAPDTDAQDADTQDAPPASAETAAEDAPEALQAAAAKPNWLVRIKGLFNFRRRNIAAVADGETETGDEAVTQESHAAGAATDASDAEDSPSPKPTFIARLKQLLRFRRKPAASDETETDDKTQAVDSAAEADSPAEEEEAPPSRLKRILRRLRNKWVWIPATSVAVLGLVSWIVVAMLHATQEKARLQAELQTAKKMLEQKTVTAVAPPAPTPAPAAASPPDKPESKVDPAFQIVGHVPAAKSEEAAGLDAGDCLVKDKASVSENLKNCITSFNQALASPTKKAKAVEAK